MHKHTVELIASILSAFVVFAATLSAPDPAPVPAFRPAQGEAPKRVFTRFSPKGGATDLVVWHVDGARKSLFVASYQWSSRPIHDAVLRARARGVKVRVVLDDGMEGAGSSLLPELVKAGLTADELRVDDKHAIFHNKVTLRDPETPSLAAHENGSFNYSASAEAANAENAQVVEGFPLATAAYLADLETHWAHSRPARPRGQPP